MHIEYHEPIETIVAKILFSVYFWFSNIETGVYVIHCSQLPSGGGRQVVQLYRQGMSHINEPCLSAQSIQMLLTVADDISSLIGQIRQSLKAINQLKD